MGLLLDCIMTRVSLITGHLDSCCRSPQKMWLPYKKEFGTLIHGAQSQVQCGTQDSTIFSSKGPCKRGLLRCPPSKRGCCSTSPARQGRSRPGRPYSQSCGAAAPISRPKVTGRETPDLRSAYPQDGQQPFNIWEFELGDQEGRGSEQ